MANEIELKIQAAVDAGNSAKSLGDLKKSLKELNSLAVEYGDTNPEVFRKVAAEAGKVRDRLEDISEASNALKGEPIEKLGGSVNLLGDGLKNLDFGKATQGTKLLTSTIKDLDFGTLTNGLKGFSKSFIDLGKAILTNPILLLGAVVLLIITKFDELKAAGGLLGKMFTALGEVVGFITDLIIKFTDALGLTNIEATKQTEKLIENKKREQEVLEERYDLEIQLAKTAGKETIDLEIEKAKAIEDNVNTQLIALEKLKQENGALSEDQEKKLQELTKEWGKHVNQVVLLEEQKRQKIIQSNEALNNTIEDLQIQLISDSNQRSNEQVKLQAERKKEEISKSIGDEKKKAEAIALVDQVTQKQIDDNNKNRQKELSDKAQQAREKSKSATLNHYQDELKLLQDQGKLEVLQTEENTKNRLNVLTDSLTKEIEFYKEKGKYIGLNETEINLRVSELTDQRKQYAEDYNNYVKDLENRRVSATLELNRINAKSSQDLLSAEIEIIKDNSRKQLDDKKLTDEERIAIEAQTLQAIDLLRTGFRDKDRQNEISAIQTRIDTILADEQFLSEFQVGKKIDAINQIKDYQIAQAQIERERILSDTTLTEEQKQQVEQDFRNKRVDFEKQAEDEILKVKEDASEKAFNISRQGLSIISSLNSSITEIENNRLKKGEKASIQVQKKQFIRQKALGIVNAGINTAEAITKAAAAAPPPFNIPLIAAAATIGAAQIAAIATKRFEPSSDVGGGGEGSSNVSIPTVSNTPSSSNTQPSFQAPQMFGIGQNRVNNPNDLNTQRVYVLESDITAVQKKVSVIENRATW
ncbi:MAG: hypothetical protein EOO06_00360 [Chitinophagaceae bacterium]|nr:MAG: hypothetical protein EOO06_00360 [Chitinophagaceae bacterium]